MQSFNPLLDAPQLLALAAALGWASGLRLYAAVFLVGAVGGRLAQFFGGTRSPQKT